MISFMEWMKLREGKGYVDAGRPGGLYPSLYTQYYNYPPADIVNWSADAIVYMDPEDIPHKVVDGYYAKIIRKSVGNYGKGEPGGH